MHQLNATQDAGARDKGTQECDQLKDERVHELQDTHVGFEATEATYSHTDKIKGTSPTKHTKIHKNSNSALLTHTPQLNMKTDQTNTTFYAR